MKTMQYLMILSSFLLLQACAGRNVEDYNNEQAQEHIAKAQREQGDWTGSMLDSTGKIIAGVAFNGVAPDTEGGISGAVNSGTQQVGLMGTIIVTTSNGAALNYGFRDAAYDVTNRVMRYTSGSVVTPDGTTDTVEIEAQFTDSDMTGKLWTGGWDSYGATFDLKRNGPLPSSSALSSGRSSSASAARSYTATVPNPNSLDTTTSTEQATLSIIDAPMSVLSFVYFFSPIVDVDLELTLGTDTAATSTVNTAIYKGAQLNTINGTLIGNADNASTLSDLNCTQDGAGGWNCTLSSTRALTMHFTPTGLQ